MLQLNNISCKRQNKILFQNLSLTFFPGMILEIHGANGSGKTSFLEILAGLLPLAEGKIRHNNLTLQYLGVKSALKESLTVKENLTFWHQFYQSDVPFETILATFQLEAYINTPVKELSKGWKKRVSLSRLLFQPADLWLLDEPFDGLDKQARTILLKLIQHKSEEGGIICIATHQSLECLSYQLHPSQWGTPC